MKSKTYLGYMPDGTGTGFPFDSLFDGVKNVLTEGWEGVTALVLWGGTDIHPSYYGEPAHQFNQVYGQKSPSRRDVNEWKAMIYAKFNSIPIIGVCRGGQLLNVFAGARLIQHVFGHTSGNHLVTCTSGESLLTTSCHHQMMYPFDVEHEMLAFSETSHSGAYQAGPGCPAYDMKDKVEPEVVFFPAVRGLAIQGHPEWMSKDSPFVHWCLKEVNSRLFNGKLTSRISSVTEKDIVCV